MSDEDAVYRWRVLRRKQGEGTSVSDRLTEGAVADWVEIGSLGTEYSSIPPEADEIGALGGAGEYLLVRAVADNYYVAQFEIEGRTAYSKVEPVEPAEEIRPESLRVEGPA